MKFFVPFVVFFALAADSPRWTDTPIAVRPTDIDSKGHVNNARFVEYLQCGRWQFFDRYGFSEERLNKLDTVFVVANLNLNFRREAKYPGNLTVWTVVSDLGKKSVTLTQFVTDAQGNTLLDGTVVLVAVDPTTHRSRTLPGELLLRFDWFKGFAEATPLHPPSANFVSGATNHEKKP